MRKKTLSEADVVAMIEAFIADSGSQRKAAQKLGVASSYLTQVRQSGKPGVRIPAVLGLRYIEGHYEN